MKKPRIVHLTLDTGTIDRRILLAARTMKEAGCEVSVITPYANYEEGFEDIEIINLSSFESDTVMSETTKTVKQYCPGWLYPYARFVYKVIKTIFTSPVRDWLKFVTGKGGFIPYETMMKEKAIETPADMYVANDLTTLPAGVEAARHHGARLIYDAHEFYTEQITLSKYEKKYLRKVESELIDFPQAVITVNSDIADLFRERYGREAEVILNAARVTENLETKYVHDLAGIPRETKVLLFQGGFSPNRNLEKLVAMAEHLREGVLVMLGWGDFETKLKEQAKSAGIYGSKIHFVPKVSQRELVGYSSSATIGVIPYPSVDLNTTYCTPNKLFEFVSAGLPLLANAELVTVNNILRKYGMGEQVDLGDLEAAAERIDTLLCDDATLEKLRENSIKARAELNWAVESERLRSICLKAFPEDIRLRLESEGRESGELETTVPSGAAEGRV